MSDQIKQRDKYVDVAKGIAILLVVRIHAEVFGEINAPYPVIAVPFFFFLSGFYDNTSKPLKSWFPKSFKRLLIVGVIWVLISFVYGSILHYIKDKTIPIAFSVEDPLIAGGVTWFLFALFYAKILMWLLHQIKIPHWLVFVILILVGGVISHFNLPFLIDEGIGALPFYYAGYVLYPYIRNNWNAVSWIALIGFVCIILMPAKWFPYVFVPYTGWSMLYPLYFIMTICSFGTVLWISKQLERQKWLANYGKQTLGILVLHPLMLHTCAVIFNRVMVKGSTPWILVFLCAYIIVCILSYYLSKWISKYCPVLLGQRSCTIR